MDREHAGRRFSRRSLLKWAGAASCAVTLGAREKMPGFLSSNMADENNAAVLRAAEAVVQPSHSDVGSLYSFIQSQARKKDFSLSFLNPAFQSSAEWKKQARRKLLDLLHYYPPKCLPKAEVVEKRDEGDYIREKIYFNTTPDIRVPAFVLIPKNLKKPAPAIVALHDHGGFYFWGKEKLVDWPGEHQVLANFKAQYYSGKSIASEMARQGYVVIVIDMFYWGERRLLLDEDAADWRDRPAGITAERISAYNQRSGQNEELVARTIYSAGFTWAGVMYWDDIRTVDYLITRPEVDPKRIGCVGLSMGALRSVHLAALDDRIKTAVIVGWMASFPAQLRRKIVNTIGFTKLVPGLYQYMDYPDVASLAAPAAILVINGKKDGLFELAGVEASFEKLHSVYQKAGAPEKCRTRFYDTPHEFNAEMQAEAWEWLRRWL
jgi:dienelactone hydrolase